VPSSDGTTATVGASDSGNAGEQGAAAPAYSETNQQVSGVDEPDIVKTDGTRIYILHGTELLVLDAAPPASTSIALEATLEGSPQEMLIHDGKVLAYSAVADPSPTSGDATLPVGSYDAYYYPYGGFTKETVIDTSGEAARVMRETYVEGSYVSARLHGSLARGVIRGGFKAPDLYNPNVDLYDAFGNPYDDSVIAQQLDEWRDRTKTAIAATELSDWLPRRYERVDDAVQAVDPECTRFYVPAPGGAQFGQTSIDTVDLADPAAEVPGVIVLGDASQVYANQDVLLLAQPDYWWWAGVADEERTALHLFTLDGEQTPYAGSGYAPGAIDDQFSLDEKEGVVRLSTTQRRWNEIDGTTSTNQVVTMQLDGGKLSVLGQSENLAPGETIYSTRFVGDIAYVVTFRQMDPLFAVDVSDPSQPTVLGELEIPGFSDYMHPLDDSHLLTIGRNIDPATQTDLGLLLQIFDVSDPTDPKQTQTYTFTRQGWSAANSDHKAFTYYEQKKLLAFPFVSYSSYPQTSTLELLRVDVGTGFEPVGSIDHSAFAQQGCTAYNELDYVYYECTYPPEVRRGLFIEDAVYSISYGGVLVHDINNLDDPLASIALPPPNLNYYYGVEGGVGVATPGSTGTGTVAVDAVAEPPPDDEAAAGGAVSAGGSAGSAPVDAEVGGTGGPAGTGGTGGT
jgi:hypothetical protein